MLAEDGATGATSMQSFGLWLRGAIRKLLRRYFAGEVGRRTGVGEGRDSHGRRRWSRRQKFKRDLL